MPAEMSLEMYAEKEVLLPFFTGHVSRGLLLHILRHVNPVVSQSLHEPNVLKPYSLTPLYFRSETKTSGGYLLDAAFPCRVRFRFLKDEFANYLVEYFSQKSTVTIIDTGFHIASMAVKSKDYLEMEKESEPVGAFRLYFRTPTYLASLGTSFHCLWPEPTRIFPNLMRLWDTYTTGKRYGKEEYVEYREWLIKNVGVAEHELKTRLVYMGRKKATGFVGWTTYEMKAKDEWNKVTCMLARFAEYSNIGGNKTGGFGVVHFRERKQDIS
jgi:CRISPR-associated endoribonuclease Cas6